MTCRATACDRPVTTRTGHQLCEMHYTRLRRNGVLYKLNTNRHPDWTRREVLSGYVQVKLPKGHPALDDLNCSNGRFLFEHRFILWQKLKGNVEACEWCGDPLTWATTHVDHLNGVRNDNRPENLVSSCQPCNIGRRPGSSNMETWATSMATRWLIRNYPEQYEAERNRILHLLQERTG